MGKPSDKIRSAQRPGKCERARVKNPRRGHTSGYVGGVVDYRITAGRKKRGKVGRHVDRLVTAHLDGDPSTMKSAVKIERPLYKIEMRPLHPANGRDQ